ncbi:DivIVA domain-containing protein [Pseudonocardia sp. GCM10023141]|uniref:DivIVA domain-containing protein n=1 Tax=Pseudonocardia sp. GCM10023141 TaxID=3252653 RepID=UPI00361FD78C
MPMLPEEITATALRPRWRGYDRAQVQTMLGRVGTDYTGAIDKIADTAADRARVRTECDELQRRLDAATASAGADAARARTEADADAAAIRARTDQAVSLVMRQAEEAAEALTRRAQALHAAAQADADAARARLDEADRRARQLEDAARDRWEALRAETEARFEQLQIAERRFVDRTRHIETALGALRSQVGLLDQVHRIEQSLTAVRADSPAGPASGPDSEHSNGHQR